MHKLIQVVASDLDLDITSGRKPEVLHTWKTAQHHGKRKMAKLMRRAQRWARKATRPHDLTWVRGV